jgi:glycerol dehydrogenase-like iron-containing ADH family enzyme
MQSSSSESRGTSTLTSSFRSTYCERLSIESPKNFLLQERQDFQRETLSKFHQLQKSTRSRFSSPIIFTRIILSVIDLKEMATALNIPTFQTVYGRGLLGEIQNIAATRYVVVTMRDLWAMPSIRNEFPSDATLNVGDKWSVYYVESLEQTVLQADLETLQNVSAKYFAWSLGAGVTLFQIPTALTVDAPWGHRAAIRVDGVVRYVGFAVPSAIYIDYGILQAAPRRLIVSGAMDVLCFVTGHFDWKLAHDSGKSGKWPYDQQVVDLATEKVSLVLDNIAEIKSVTEKGIKALCSAFQFGGGAFHALGWNPRPLEGIDHLGFYALEARTRKAFIHGQAVGLFIFIGAFLQQNKAEFLLKSIIDLGVDIRPEAMGVTWDDVETTLLNLKAFAEEHGGLYTIASHLEITQEHCDKAKRILYAAYESSSS